ncbi:GNAT family N-acetyltransferase [Aeromicrobium sp.]|uniref:GNAT family N-acetyltransferase n=1 Tax=Aeromicrobium sp. TaxID=1871063 RepID=UPI003D6B9024
MRWPLSVPVLSDGVVTLRAHVPTDVDLMLEMCRDPEALRWTSIPLDSTQETVEDYAFTVIPRGWDEESHRGWAIEAEGRYAGNVDVRDTPIADIGFVLHPWARGRGLMVRAVRLATDWALVEGGVEIVHWRANVGNVDSLRVAHAAGFSLHGVTPGIVQQRDLVVDAWAGSRRFGDAPVPLVRWAESPVIETERLRLRPFVEADIPRVVETCSDETTRHWLNGMPHPYVEATARGYLNDCVWQAARGAKATWAVADRDTDMLLGNVAVMDMLGWSGSGEVGYWTHPDARGRGVMTEAVRAVVDHAFDRSGLNLARLMLYAAAGNPPSNAVAVAAGFRHFGTQTAAELLGDGSVDDLNGYELLRP